MNITLKTSTRRTSKTTPSPKNKRADIQGLRALAVTLVILSHLFDWPSGGFLGVDVFFVISGFVITTSLLKEHNRTGHISFAGFYRRRIRRILPASVLVLAATCIAAYYAFFNSRFQETVVDALWALLFGANWRFAAIGTDYMQAEGPVSPIQHYWSLSIEEQFYFAWPAVMLAALTISTRRGLQHHSRKIAAGIIGAAVCASFAWAVIETSTRADYAYFSTFTRVWELGAGALLALVASMFTRIPVHWRTGMAWAGLVGIIASAFLMSADSGWPAPWAAIPVASTMMVIAAGIGGQPRYLSPLTNGASQYIGDISYSLYLWHFQVIVIFAAVMPVDTYYYALCLATMLMLSIVGYHTVEAPINSSKWMEPKAIRLSRKTPILAPSIKAGKEKIFASFALFVAAASAWAITWTPAPPSYTSTYIAAGNTSETRGDGGMGAASSDGPFEAQLASAVAATAWPSDLSPTLESLGSIRFDGADTIGCAPTRKSPNCDLGGIDPSRTAVVVGNSIAIAYLPAIRQVLGDAGWQVRALTMSGCPFIDAETVSADDGVNESCSAHKDEVVRLINDRKPALVIGAGQNSAQFKQSGQTLAGALDLMLSKFQGSIRTYVHLSPPPRGKNPQECASRFTPPGSCLDSLPPGHGAAISSQAAVMNRPGRMFVDTTSWYCTTDGWCPIFSGGTMVRRDQTHLTPEYAMVVAPLLAERLESVL